MLIALIIAQPFTIALALWLVLRHNTRRDTQHQHMIERLADSHHTGLQALVDALKTERDSNRAEVQTLCQRIQAPTQAVAAYAEQDVEPQNPWPLTEEESVKAQDVRTAALAAIEQLEREEAAETRLMAP